MYSDVTLSIVHTPGFVLAQHLIDVEHGCQGRPPRGMLRARMCIVYAAAVEAHGVDICGDGRQGRHADVRLGRVTCCPRDVHGRNKYAWDNIKISLSSCE